MLQKKKKKKNGEDSVNAEETATFYPYKATYDNSDKV